MRRRIPLLLLYFIYHTSSFKSSSRPFCLPWKQNPNRVRWLPEKISTAYPRRRQWLPPPYRLSLPSEVGDPSTVPSAGAQVSLSLYLPPSLSWLGFLLHPRWSLVLCCSSCRCAPLEAEERRDSSRGGRHRRLVPLRTGWLQLPLSNGQRVPPPRRYPLLLGQISFPSQQVALMLSLCLSPALSPLFLNLVIRFFLVIIVVIVLKNLGV